MKIFDFWKRKKPPSDDAAEDIIKKKYQSYKKLFGANNAVLEIMSRLKDVSEADFIFDMQYIRSKSDLILEWVQEIVNELNILGDNRYAALIPIYENLKAKIHQEVAIRPPETAVALALPLHQLDRSHLLQVGGKNANLGEMKNRLQFPAPEGFVLTTEAYRLVLEENNLNQALQDFWAELDIDDLGLLTEKSRLFRERLTKARIPARLAEEVNQQYRGLTQILGFQPHLALRSSGLYEDQEFSFAGQFLTRLNVTLEEFFPAYMEVLASQFSPAALTYLVQKGLARHELAMSVGCLAMVPARASGVLFTEDPTAGHPGVMVVEASWGLGPTIVEGTLIPDRYLLSKTPEISLLAKEIKPKPFRLMAAASEGGLNREAVPESENAQPALSQAELRQLGRYGLELEKYFGEPQDIEFAVDSGGQIILLQSRPLTVLRPQQDVSPAAAYPDHPVLIERGAVACFGVAAGPAFIVANDNDLAQFPEGAILVVRHSKPDYGSVLHKAKGLLVDIGSATSHLAILAREYKKPTLVDTYTATQVLQTGQEITVDADNTRVYQGRVVELLQSRTLKPSLLTETPLYATLRRVLRWITPLNLTDPKLSDFNPASCRTLHDITRFAHQKAVAEMFELGDQARQEETTMVRLKTPIPLNLYLIDLGGGIEADRRAKFVTPEAITSIPMQALWRGISHPQVSWAGPIPIDMKGLSSVFSRSLTAAAPQNADFWLRTLAIVSKNYLNFSSRLGYHFATIDAYVSEARNDNYISFRFMGGAADEHRRGLRARFLGRILQELDFDVEITRDLVVAKLGKYPQNLLEEKLDLLGRLMACARQRDMVMGDEKMMEKSVQAFLAGNYRFDEP